MQGSLTPDVQRVAQTLMEGLGTPRALAVAMLLKYGEWDQLTQLSVSPDQYDCPDRYLRDMAATSFLKKMDGLPVDIDLEAATFKQWLWAEKQCFRTNQRFNEISDFGTLNGSPVPEGILLFLDGVKKNLKQLLGENPPQLFDGRFGPGATMSDISGRTTVLHKMSSVPTSTPSALFYLVPWTGTKWAAACAARGDVPETVRGNAYFTVNKHSRIKRPCAKEPSINGFYQLGLGRVMRGRLKAQGIDLENGQNVHRQVACAASKSGEFCTVDLTSASDCCAAAFVRAVAPPMWHEVLSDLRSSHTQIRDIRGKKHWVRLEKFSSMGNGFTFELETALFAAIVMTVMRGQAILGHNVFVYGDDIICPSEFYSEVSAALRFCGFTPNPMKSFSTGYFRESCGGDFLKGVAVRPYFLKEDCNEPQQFISLANGIRRLSLQGTNPDLRAHLRRAWFSALDCIPTPIRACRGPEDLGDLVIHDDEEKWNTRWRANGIRYVRVYRPAKFRGTSFDRFDPDIQFAGALYGVALRQILKPRKNLDNRSVLGRDAVEGYKVGWTPYS
ncbi:RNA-directed RNA polymerase [ssRNA phage SRR7976299_11]|uniref:RNA-directed RNA polymerase n=1 Tax=ssRNA phage SRR7976299_11 TaxID=2786633 RepID=A0A8S5L167_9VIRU|nr:RNA-directed RNA polymerase [ssRNA phage SRR7976299_11]DAD51085.1 TPA_asm: RNA-directed RNA polymerase [ssRNA phage SRR7976299_11]